MITTTTTAHAARFEVAAWLAHALQRLSAWVSPAARTGTLDSVRVERIEAPLGRRVTCLSGALWLTFDGEPSDIVLEAGPSIVCEHDTPLLISGFGRASWQADQARGN
jgi:hypothetical protein